MGGARKEVVCGGVGGKGLCSMLPQVLFAVAGTTTSIRENKEPSFVKLGTFTNFE